MRGLPYSGKTSWAREYCSRKRDAVRVSWTEIRSMMSERVYDREITHCAVYIALRQVQRLLLSGKTVILDEMNLYGPSFSLFVGIAQKCKAKVTIQVIRSSVEECKQRCLRDGGSSADAMRIEMLAEKYSLLLK